MSNKDQDAALGYDFGAVLQALKEGDIAFRKGWNSKNMFIFLVPGSVFKVNRAPLMGIFPEGTSINYHSHIDMKTAKGDIVPWLASQTDLLSTDWEIEIIPEGGLDPEVLKA